MSSDHCPPQTTLTVIVVLMTFGQTGCGVHSLDSQSSQDLDDLDRRIDDFVSKRASGSKERTFDDELTFLIGQGSRARPSLEKAYQRNKSHGRRAKVLLDLYDGFISVTRVTAADVDFMWRAILEASTAADLGPLIGMTWRWRMPPRNRRDVKYMIDLLNTKDPLEGTHLASMGILVSIVQDWFDFVPTTEEGLSGLAYRKELAREYGRWFDRVSDYSYREYTATEQPDGSFRYQSRVKVNTEAQKANKPVDFLTGKTL